MKSSASETSDDGAKKKLFNNAEAQATFSDKSSDADAIGTQFWDMLTVLLDLLWEPEQVFMNKCICMCMLVYIFICTYVYTYRFLNELAACKHIQTHTHTQMNEKLIVTTHRFYELGIRVAHLDTIGKAIQTTLERIMASSWLPKHTTSWKWFWDMTCTTMTQVSMCLHACVCTRLHTCMCTQKLVICVCWNKSTYMHI
jgi:hypothetical protein